MPYPAERESGLLGIEQEPMKSGIHCAGERLFLESESAKVVFPSESQITPATERYRIQQAWVSNLSGSIMQESAHKIEPAHGKEPQKEQVLVVPKPSAVLLDEECSHTADSIPTPLLQKAGEQLVSSASAESLCLKAYMGSENEHQSSEDPQTFTIPVGYRCQSITESPFQLMGTDCIPRCLSSPQMSKESGPKMCLFEKLDTSNQIDSSCPQGQGIDEEVSLDVVRAANKSCLELNTVTNRISKREKRELMKHPACILGAIGMGVAIATSSLLPLWTKEQ